VYEVPKVWFVNRIIEILGIAGLLLSPRLKKKKYDKNLFILVIGFLSLAIISSLVGVDLQKSFLGNYYRADGLFTTIHFLILFLFLHLYFQKTWLESIFKAVAYSNFILNLLVILCFFLALSGKYIFENWDGSFGANFGNPNFLAGYLLVTLPFTYYFFEKKKKAIAKLPFTLQLVGIILTGSLAGIIGAILYVAYLTYINLINNKFIMVILILIAITGLSFVLSNQRTYRNGFLVAESRERIIMKGLIAFKQRPFFGWGWANFDYAFDSVDWPIKINDDIYVDKAHSSLLEILVTTGVFGFTIYFFLLLRIGRNIYFSTNKYKKYLFSAFVILILHMQTNIISVSEELFFWILAGFSVKNY